MTKKSRILFGVATALLVFTYFFPLWKITLDAPQYPEGVGLLIWSNTITGVKPHDLQNINGLNHYIGMKEIVPDSIPELKFMPYLIGLMIAFGAVVFAANRKKLLHAWIIALVVLGAAGMTDFYLWNYDYGHNLDLEKASIKIPGMVYQPPLIGSKKLLNFTANSYPAFGGWMIFLSLGLAVAAAWNSRKRLSANPSRKKILLKRVAAVSGFLVLTGCTPQTEAIDFGADACANCKMTIVEPRFGSELLTIKGKVYKFDAIECLAKFTLDESVAPPEVHSLWVPAIDADNVFIEAKNAIFLHLSLIHI